jgi:N-acetylglucosaminyl-diphospho-decaprenol L-rhamnosyltransferase
MAEVPQSTRRNQENESPMDVSIIYVNWNSAEYIAESIRSVYEHTDGIQFEIIVVDNASPAGNVDVLKEQFPEITLIKSATNLGFAGANNLGYKSCSGENVLFLNPDTKLVNSAINAMLRHLRSLPDAGIIGCKLLNSDLSVQTSCIQTFPTILNQVLDVDFLRRRWPKNPLWGIGPLYSDSTEPAKVEVVSGACLMIKRATFEKVSMFSEDYFMYAEDLDLCYKVVQAGCSNYYTGEGTVIHYGGKSSEPQSATMMKWRAIPRFCDKNRGRFYGFIFRIVMALTAMGRLAVIKIASVFGNTFAPKTDLNSALAKWRTILSILLTQSAPS